MSRFERWSVWTTTAAMLSTGVVYWWMKEVMTPSEPWAVINHPLQPWMLKAHILVAPLLVFSVGLITSRHIWRHYRAGVRNGRRSGAAATLTFAALVATGYALQVFTAELLLRGLMWGHLGLGIIYSLGVAAHWPATRGAAPRRAQPEPRPSLRRQRTPALGESRIPEHDMRRRDDRPAHPRGDRRPARVD
jgi:hypothetical protein